MAECQNDQYCQSVGIRLRAISVPPFATKPVLSTQDVSLVSQGVHLRHKHSSLKRYQFFRGRPS